MERWKKYLMKVVLIMRLKTKIKENTLQRVTNTIFSLRILPEMFENLTLSLWVFK